MNKTVLITGANRGIGLEFVRQYANKGWHVIATCRQPDQAEALQTLVSDKIQVLPCDIADQKSVSCLSEQLKDVALDCLINNAGAYSSKGERFDNVTAENMLAVFRTNTLGTLAVCQAFEPQLRKGEDKLIVVISTKVSSIADNRSGGSYSYRASKTALNMVMKNVAIDLADTGIHVLLLHPGWVKTEMGGPNALITVEESVAGMCNVVGDARQYASPSFMDYSGQEIPW